MLSNQEIEERKSIWIELAELWKNTELMDFELEHLAKSLRDSKYELKEIEKICFEEVAPAGYKNLLDYSGSWTGFQEDWLIQKIVENINRQNSSTFYRMWVESYLGRSIMTKMIQEDWDKVVSIYNANISKN